MRRLAVILVSALCCGCFVLDEIDAGQKEMNRYDTKKSSETSDASPTAAKDKAPSPAERARQWWNSAHTFTPRADDAKSDIVTCKVGAAIRFTTQSDCTSQGGRVTGS